MRLLDRVAACSTPLLLNLKNTPTARFEVTGAHDFAARIVQCPLRFVLGDDLVRASAELAFADGERLAGCLDLLRVPARQMWIEWNDEVHKRVIFETESAADYDAASSGRRAGVLVEGSADGYGAMLRTFWADGTDAGDGEVELSPMETHIDLRGDWCSQPARSRPCVPGGRGAGRSLVAGIFFIAVRQGRYAFGARVAVRDQPQTAGSWPKAAAGSRRSVRFARCSSRA